MKALMTYFVEPIKSHYVDFSGRATRKQFWLFVLFYIIVMVVAGLLLGFLGDTGTILVRIFQLALLLPSLAIMARRLRDAGFSPWWLLIGLVPFIGGLVLFVFYLLPSKN